MTSIDASFFKEVITSELDSLMTNHTWKLVDLPKGCKSIKCKRIFRKKMRPDGSIEKFKAILVVIGYTQKKGIDYFDTYSLVTKTATIITLVALGAIYDLMVHQMDIKTIILNGNLEEEIYIEQLEGLVCSRHENKVCKLKKSLYGLKQIPKQWYQIFDQTLISNFYIVNGSDSYVYSIFSGSDCVIMSICR